MPIAPGPRRLIFDCLTSHRVDWSDLCSHYKHTGFQRHNHCLAPCLGIRARYSIISISLQVCFTVQNLVCISADGIGFCQYHLQAASQRIPK